MIRIISIFSLFLLLSLGNGQETPISRIADFDMPESLGYIAHEQGESLVKNNYSYLTNVKTSGICSQKEQPLLVLKIIIKEKLTFWIG